MNPIYFVECSYGRGGRAFMETDRDHNSRQQVIDDIVSSQIECPVRVLEIREDEGTCRDISEDIAQELVGMIWSESVPDRLRDFIDNYIGAGECDRIDAEIANARSDYKEHNTHRRAYQGI